MSNLDIVSHLEGAITASSVSKWASGLVDYPSLHTALAIYKADAIAIMPFDGKALEKILEESK